MDIRFDGKLAVVTGAGSGIGFACAEELIKCGAKVAMIGRDVGKLARAAEMLSVYGEGMAVPFQLDLAESRKIGGVIDDIRRQLGEIDILIQAAGILNSKVSGSDFDEKWDNMLAVNAKAVAVTMEEVYERSMKERKSGVIVNISSVAGISGMVKPLGTLQYSSSKGAVCAMTRQAAVHWAADGVRVNCVAPGGVASQGVGAASTGAAPAAPAKPGQKLPFLDMIPTGRHSSPYEIASAALFLCSDFAQNIVGQTLVVDGGGTLLGL